MTEALRADQLIADAESVTRLDDWGGAPYFDREFRALLDTMVHSLQHESVLTEAGMLGARLRLAAALEARLRFIDDRERYAEIAGERIVRPMIILGLPRSGSTFLQTLLAQDPANRVPLTWEMMLPSPAPTAADPADNPRIARCDALLAAMGLQTPEILSLHPFGARLPEEDHLMTEIILLGDNLPALWRMPAFNKLRATLDSRIAFDTLKMVLQHLQFRHKRERMLLKNPGYLFRLRELLTAFPDALLVQTHRDPAKVIPSVAALLVLMRRNSSHDVAPPDKIALGNLRAFTDGLTKAIEFRRHGDMNERFCDVHFRAMIADPIGTAESIYAHFNLNLSSAARGAMQRWLDDSASHTAMGRHTLAAYGLTEAAIDRSFGDYMAHYGVARER